MKGEMKNKRVKKNYISKDSKHCSKNEDITKQNYNSKDGKRRYKNEDSTKQYYTSKDSKQGCKNEDSTKQYYIYYLPAEPKRGGGRGEQRDVTGKNVIM